MSVTIGRTVQTQIKKIDDDDGYILTTNVTIPNLQKILFINTVENFDLFTHLYGYKESKYSVGINWINVFNHFKGFKLDCSLFNERFFNVYFDGKMYSSWWDDEYYYDDKIIIPY